jgi:hypothetical protein
MKNTQLRIRFNRISYRTLDEQKSRSAETSVASRPKRLAEYSQKEGFITHYQYMY